MAEELAERVAYLEREMQRAFYVTDGIQKYSNTQFIAISTRLDKLDKDMRELKSDMRELKSSVADITANNIEIRNILAPIVQKLG
jgi:hypothetical protein